MAKDVIHVTEAEATDDFAGVLARVRAGSEVVIENHARAVAVVRPVETSIRSLSESLHLAKAHGSAATLDGDFAHDLERVVGSRRAPLIPPAWD